MSRQVVWRQDWEVQGVRLTSLEPRPQSLFFTHHEFAGMNDYDATMLGLPRHMEATMVLSAIGRIDHPGFRVDLRLESSTQMHAWAVYRRDAARLFVGEREMRLNAHQYALFNAWDAMQAAGGDVAARLRAWPALVKALHAPHHARIVVLGHIPHLHITETDSLPPNALTRINARLQRAGHAAWAMLPHRRYFITSN
jgi:hypothetical protein